MKIKNITTSPLIAGLFIVSGVTVSNASTLLVNFTDGGGDADALGNNAAVAADFASVDSGVDAGAAVQLINGDAFTDGTTVTSGVGITGDLTIGIGQNGFSPNNGNLATGEPIIGGYLFANVGQGNPGVEVQLDNIVGINAGDVVTVTVYAVGDNAVQTNSVLFGINGAAVAAPAPADINGNAVTIGNTASLADSSVQFSFTAASAITELDLQAVAEGGPFSNINGFSITTVAVPEPSSTALLGLGGLALVLRRRR